MKKLFWLLFLVGQAFSLEIKTGFERDVISCNLEFDPLKIDRCLDYSIVKSEGCRDGYSQGLPLLPVKDLFILLPPNAEISDINIVPDSIRLDGNYNIPAVPKPIPMGTSPPIFVVNHSGDIIQVPDEFINYYKEPEEDLKSLVNIGPIQRLSGYSLLPISIFAANYEKKTKSLYWTKNIRVELKLKTPKILAVPEFYREKGDLLPYIIANPEVLSSYKKLKTQNSKLRTTYQYIVITDDELASSFIPLINSKQNRGITSTILTLFWIYKNYQGRDNQEKIRNCIIDYYKNYETEYVLLGGDVEIVPYRGVFAQVGEDNKSPERDSNIPCDLYFSSLDGDWDKDKDNIFGELTDNVDLIPEVYVGRAPVNTQNEAQAFVNKVLTYLSNPTSSHLLNTILIGYEADTLSDCRLIKEEIASFIPIYFNLQKEYESEGGVSKERVIGTIEGKGCGIINHCGHANYWTVPPFGDGGVNGRPIVDSLKNKDKYFIFYTIGCLPAQFEVSDSIAEHFVNNPQGGAVSFVGNSRYGWYEYGNPKKYSGELDVSFFDQLFQKNVKNIGKTLAFSKIPFIPFSNSNDPYRWTQFCLNLLGDPEMEVPIPFYDLKGEITEPKPDADISGIVHIRGRAEGDDFLSYKLEYLSGSEWRLINSSSIPVGTGGTLGIWDTRNLEIGWYTLRLTVFGKEISGFREIKCWVDNTQYKPGWPFITRDRVWTSASVADVDGDGRNEIAITTAEIGRLTLYLFDEYGKVLPGWPIKMPDYYGIMGFCVYDHSSSPALGDIDGDGDLEIVLFSGGYLRAFHSDGTCVKGFPITLGGQFNTPTLADLDGDLDLEIIASLGSRLYAIQGDGRAIWRWPGKEEEGASYKGVSVGDIDNNGDLEIAFDGNPFGCDYSNYILEHNGKLKSIFRNTHGIQPTLSDLDNDGAFEIIFPSPGRLNVLNKDGMPYPGWPREIRDFIPYFPASIGDIDGDKEPEICVSGWYYNSPKLYAFHSDGRMLPGFPVNVGNYPSPISIGDIDNDQECEILIGASFGEILAFNNDGSKVSGFPIKTKRGVISQPVVVDIDKDGKTEIIYGTTKGGIYVKSTEGSLENNQWPLYCNDQVHRGAYPKKKPYFTISAPKMVETGVSFPITISSNNSYSGKVSLGLNEGTITPKEAFLNGTTIINITIHTEGEMLFIKAFDANGNYGISNPIRARADLIPPSKINDLKVKEAGCNSIILTWTSPGDDGVIGTATFYDIRYSTSTINEYSFRYLAERVENPPKPKEGGEKEEFFLSGLLKNQVYYIGIKAIDDSKNEGLLSNIAIGTTSSASISISPNQGVAGTEVYVSGSNFPPFEAIRIDFGTYLSIATARTSQKGTFTSMFSAKAQPSGAIIVRATSETGVSDFTFFTIPPFYSISGYILDKTQKGISGVSMSLSGVIATRTYTDNNGFYRFALVPSSYAMIYPSYQGLKFIPPSRSYNPLNCDLTLQNFVEVTTYIDVFPTSSKIGASVKMYGYGFGKQEVVSIDFGTTLTIATFFTNIAGEIYYKEFIINTQPGGTKTITAKGLSSGIYTTTIFILKRPGFVMEELPIPELWIDPSISFGDYNNDGWMDFAICGKVWLQDDSIAKIYKNNKGKFIDSGNVFPRISDGFLSWLDYDNDSDLDILLTGSNIAKIYRNNNGSFTDSGINLSRVNRSRVAVGDYDNDGDCDIAMIGIGSDFKLYRNENQRMIDTKQKLVDEIDLGYITCSDYDNDGDLDIGITGNDLPKGIISKIFRNDGGIFQDSNIEITPFFFSAMAWADIDNDGDLDLVIGGIRVGSSYKQTKLYRNTNGVLIWDESIKLRPNPLTSIAFGDYDNDGWIDLAMIGGGVTRGDEILKIYKNVEGRAFVEMPHSFPGLQEGTVAWADYDNDGDLDLFTTGHSAVGNDKPKLYINDEADFIGGNNPNKKPNPPTQLTSTFKDGKVILSWDYGTDYETPKEGLYYNIRIGTASGRDNIVSSRYGTPLFGNYLGLQSRFLPLYLPCGTYYWAVQSIDTGLSTSDWSNEKIFTISPLISISPTSGPVGCPIIASGSGFSPQENIRIDFGSKNTIALCRAGSFGSFKHLFLVPSQAQGLTTIVITGLSSKISCSTSFLITGGSIPRIVEIFPKSSVNSGTKTIKILGKNFYLPSVRLKKGNFELSPYSLSATSNRIICQFDLTGIELGLYDIVVTNKDSFSCKFPSCFTVSRPVKPPITWVKDNIDPGIYIYDIEIGDADNDGSMNVYSVVGGKITSYKKYPSGWRYTSIPSYLFNMAMGDGNCDGKNELYGISGSLVHQIIWDESEWKGKIIGEKEYRSYNEIVVGDGNNDGLFEVYFNSGSNLLSYLSFNGEGWTRFDIGTIGVSISKMAIGDCDDDGESEIYCASGRSIFQVKWAVGWNIKEIDSGINTINNLTMGDGDNDGQIEIYATNHSNQMFQLKWSNNKWNKTIFGNFENVGGIAIGDGNNDGLQEVYTIYMTWELEFATQTKYLVFSTITQFTWTGSNWKKWDIPVGSATTLILNMNIACGDCDNDGTIELYPVFLDLFQLKPISVSPNITLKKSVDKAKVIKGGTITYTITYTNTGSSTATDVVIIDVLPEKVELSIVHSPQSIVNYWVDGVWQDDFSDNATKLRWLIPEVAPGESGNVRFTVKVK